MKETENGERRCVATAIAIPRDRFKAYEKAGHLDDLLKEEKEWLLESILLTIKENAEKLIKYDIVHEDDEVAISASLGVFIQQDDDKNE